MHPLFFLSISLYLRMEKQIKGREGKVKLVYNIRNVARRKLFVAESWAQV